MEVKFTINDKKLDGFTNSAKKELVEYTNKYAVDVVNEAVRSEASLREHGNIREITANIIFQSVRKLKSKPHKRFKALFIILNLLSNILFAVAGWMFDLDEMSNNHTLLFVFLLISIASIALTIFLRFRED